MVESLLLLLAASSVPPCDLRSSTYSTVTQIAQEGDDLVGRCVRLTGYSDGRSLFPNGEALREAHHLKSIKLMGMRLSDEMIGVYDLPQQSPPLRLRDLEAGVKWTLVGRVDTCDDLDRKAEREAKKNQPKGGVMLVMITGYCHYLSGPVLLVTEARVIPDEQ